MKLLNSAFGYQEDATGLKLLGHRYYDSSTGRFRTRDPIKDGRNWFSYGAGYASVTGGADPNGLKWHDPMQIHVDPASHDPRASFKPEKARTKGARTPGQAPKPEPDPKTGIVTVRSQKMSSWLPLLVATSFSLNQAPTQTDPADRQLPMVIPVVVVNFFPLKGDQIDIEVTGDWGEKYATTKAKTERLTTEAIAALEEGSRFRAYKNPTARPSLRYQVVANYEFKEAMPTLPGQKLIDYGSIVRRIGIQDWVENRGVKQVWIWGYHGGKVDLWESNMASRTGDVSNSNRSETDLPVFNSTYTVYHYNYQRGVPEMVENHMHQLEHLLNHADGRDVKPPERWSELLFWGKFVGSDASHKLVTNPRRCGWTHYAPNSVTDYDWANPAFVESDIEDWRPDGGGKVQRISSDRWAGDNLRWKIYWLQAIPGARHGLTYQGKPLRNWWTFVHDWDKAKREGWTLTMP
ncbi:MAG: hypothetical protein MUC92_09990 [Fimbriimonadaceae bacterium]|jgi:RHS repeat-associated protein|nr:hypothetical protein [Fimbriimonadaceae bacterium]